MDLQKATLQEIVSELFRRNNEENVLSCNDMFTILQALEDMEKNILFEYLTATGRTGFHLQDFEKTPK